MHLSRRLPPGSAAGHSNRMRWTPTALLFLLTAAVVLRAEPSPASRLAQANDAAHRILRRIDLQLRPPAAETLPGRSGGNPLARYAAAPSADTTRVESTVDYARRTLAGTATARLTPEASVHFLRGRADEILAALGEAPPGSAAVAAQAADLRVIAELGRFHARRLEAAIHYNLFLRGLRIAELVAATYAEKDAVEHWRALMRAVAAADSTTVGPAERPLRLSADWRGELTQLEASLRDLEEQCCPPDAAVLRERVWQAGSAEALAGPVISPAAPPPWHAGEALPFSAAVRSPHGVTAVTLRLRVGAGEGEFRTIPMIAAPGGVYEAQVSAETITEAASFEYFFEAISGSGAGSSFPAPDAAHPTLNLALRR